MALTMIHDYLVNASRTLDNLDVEEVGAVLTELELLKARGGRLFLIGNGGGAGHASHAAADFRKIAGIEAYAWGENLSDLTAYVNDHGWESATANWLADSRCGPNDAVLVFSVGGTSREISVNLKEAIFWAKGGPTVLGIVGSSGGYVAQNADAWIRIPSGETPHVEGTQAVLWHLLCTALG